MSITSTLTTIGAAGAGAGGGLSYWVNKATITQDYGWQGTPGWIEYNQDYIVANAMENHVTAEDGAVFLVYDQDGNNLSKNSYFSNSSSSRKTEAKSFFYDSDTGSWYSENYRGGDVEVLRYSDNPGLSVQWHVYGDGNNDGFPGEITSLSSTEIGFVSRGRLPSSSWNCPVYNIVNKSNGSSVARYPIGAYNYDYYPSAVAFEKYGSALYGYIGFYYYQSGLKGAVVKINKSNGNIVWTKRLVYSTPYDYYSGRCVAISPDDEGNVLLGFDFSSGNNPLICIDSSGNVLWTRSSDSEIICIDWDNVNDRWIVLGNYRMGIHILNRDGSNGARHEMNVSGISLDMYYSNSGVSYDFENNIAYINANISGGDHKLIVKRPIDGSLDGTYGDYTLATTSSYIGTNYTSGYYVQNISSSRYSSPITYSSTSTSYSNNSRISHTKTDIG